MASFLEEIGPAAQGVVNTVTSPTTYQNIGHSLTHLSDWEAGGDIAKTWDNLFHGNSPGTQQPGAQPSLKDANMQALQSELQKEKYMRSTWSMLTGGEGLLDKPTTQGATLLGS